MTARIATSHRLMGQPVSIEPPPPHPKQVKGAPGWYPQAYLYELSTLVIVWECEVGG